MFSKKDREERKADKQEEGIQTRRPLHCCL